MNQSKAQYDLCVIGHVFFELFWPREECNPEPGVELFLDDIHVGLGGALNTSSVADALGCKVVLLHPKGNGLTDFAIEGFIRSRHIDTLTWPAVDNPAITIVLHRENDRSFISKEDRKALAHCPELPYARFIHVAGINLAINLADRLADARAAGAKICVSGSWCPEHFAYATALRNMPWDIFILNDKEAGEISGSVEKALDELPGRAARDVVVTCGADGALAVIDNQRVSAPGKKVIPLDFTGTGDAFCAGFLGGRLRGLTPERCLALANEVASRMLTVRGGVVPNVEMLKDLEDWK